MIAKAKNKSKPRAVGYCRTSGEGQRDNTSIPRQKRDVENFVNLNNWEFICHYVDEGISGAKIEGRDNFKRMMKDAANGQFDIIVIYDISRFARDGGDIVIESKVLKKNFSVDVIDTKGFDTRNHQNVMMNFVRAGMTQDERLRIMERNIGGRIEKAKNGLPWCCNPPAGRAFSKEKGKWFVTEKGDKLGKLLERYAEGEPLKALAKEYGYLCPSVITRNIHQSQLSGQYQARFHAPEIGIDNLRVDVPGIPEIITTELEKRVRERASHNQRCNKQVNQKYLLTGFVKCSHCNRALTGQTSRSVAQKNYPYYYHNQNYRTSGRDCPYRGIRAELLESQALDYLYNFFLDKPTYNKALKNALPSNEDREALVNDIKGVEKQLAKSAKGISNLGNALAAGADISLFLDKQNELKAEKKALEKRRDELVQTLASMPAPELIQQQAVLLRLQLVQEHKGKDWRKLPYDNVRRFLHFLFGDNPYKNGYGIFVGLINNKWEVTFKGQVKFCHDVIDGRPVSQALSVAAERESKELRRIYDTGVREANREYGEDVKEMEKELRQAVDYLKRYKVNQ